MSANRHSGSARKVTQYGSTFSPDQTIINEYVGGQGIDPHADLEDQFDDAVRIIHLNGWASFVFTWADVRTIWLTLEPRSLLIVEGECRYWPWHTDRSLHYTPIRARTSLAARGCNTQATAEYTNVQWGGLST